MTEQSSKVIRKAIREIEHQVLELENVVMATPTGQVREDITESLIFIKIGIERLLRSMTCL